MLNTISLYIIPTFIILIISNGLLKKAPVFDLFLEGAKDGLKTSVKILPSLIGLVTAIAMLRASGFFDILQTLISPLLSKINFPEEIIPLALVRPVSGSASLAVVQDIFNNYGPDSFAGRCASVIMGSTETTFYTLAVYFGYVKIKNTGYTLKCALLADLTGIIAGVAAVRLLFY